MLSLAFYPTWIASSQKSRGVSLFGNSHRLPHVLKVFSKPMAAVDYFPFTQVLTVAHVSRSFPATNSRTQETPLGVGKNGGTTAVRDLLL